MHASVTKNTYRGCDFNRPAIGFNVNIANLGTVIMGISRKDAQDAVEKLNASDNIPETLKTIRASLVK